MEPLQNENGVSSPLQRLLIGFGAFIVIALTVVAAIFLAMQDLPEDGQSTVVGQVSPTRAVTGITPVLTPPTFTPTPPSPTPTNTPTDTPSPSATPQAPPVETTQAPDTPAPPPTDTPVLPPPTFTPVPPPPPPTATPTPAALTNCGTPPPAGWVAYTVLQNETLDSLAKRSGTSVFEVQQANCLPSINIQNGQIIYLPSTPATVTPTFTPTIAPTNRPAPTRTGTPISPVVDDVVPDNVPESDTGQETVITVLGKNFRSREAGFTVELRGLQNVILQLRGLGTDTNFDAIVPADLPRGTYDLVVTNPAGRAGVKESAFVIGPVPTPTAIPNPPEITRVSPSSGRISEDVLLTIQGRNFRPLEAGFKVELRLDDGTLSVELPVDETSRPATSTSFDAAINANSLIVGSYDLLVTNPDGQTDIERDIYDAIE